MTLIHIGVSPDGHSSCSNPTQAGMFYWYTILETVIGIAIIALYILGLLERCDSVLESLHRSRAGIIAERRREQAKTIRKEVSSCMLGKRFQKKTPRPKKKSRPAWRHRFVCLGYYGQERIPTTDADKDELFKAGLGEKEVEFERLDLDASEFRAQLIKVFPKLSDCGGFQFCKCLPNSRNLEPLSDVAHSSPEFLRQRVGNVRTYIRPLQKDLDLSPCVDVPEQVTDMKCACLHNFNVHQLQCSWLND